LLKISFSRMRSRLLRFTTEKGELYDLVKQGFWGKNWVWTKNGTVLIRFHMHLGMKKSGEITIEHNDPMEILLLLAGSYGLLMKKRTRAHRPGP